MAVLLLVAPGDVGGAAPPAEFSPAYTWPTFADAVTQTHQARSKVEVVDSVGTVVATLACTGGAVVSDRNAAHRRRLEGLTAVGTSAVPITHEDFLHPVSPHRLRVSRGILLGPDDPDDVEWVALGTFGTDDVTVTDTGDGLTVTAQGTCRSKRVSRNRWVDSYAVAASTDVLTAIQALVTDRDPTASFNVVSTSTRTVGPLVLGASGADNDPWADAVGLARSAGLDLYVGADDRYTVRDEPDPATAPIMRTLVEGASSVLLSLQRAVSRERTYNGAVVTGRAANASATIRAEAWDDDPASPTYYLGDYGRQPTFLSSEMISTSGQASDAATALLRRSLGATEQVSLGIVPDPRLDAGHVVVVQRLRAGVDARYVVDEVRCPLDPAGSGGMSLRCRERRTVA